MRDCNMKNARLAALCALLLGGCGGAEPGAERALDRGNGGDPGTLDPLLADDVHAFNVVEDLYEGLVTVAADGSIVPGVAESWSVSDDGRTWRFLLRQDARWSDGSSVVAADFLRSFQRLASPEVASSYEFLLQPVAGFEEINAGTAALDDLGVRVIADDILEMDLRSSTPYWLSVLSMPIAMPTPATGADVYNGAYVLVERRLEEIIRLERNEAYWNSANVAIRVVNHYPIANPEVEFNRYRAGDLDMTASVPTAAMRMLAGSTELQIAPSLGLYYIAFDLTEPPFDQLGIRKALTMAIDRDVITTVLGRGEQAAFGIVPPSVHNYRPSRYDWRNDSVELRLDQARRLLADAGYSDDKPLAITFLYDVGDVHERVAVAVADMWQRLGFVEVELEKREWKYFLDTRDRREEWQAMRFSWVGDYDDATTFLDIFRSDSPQNLAGYSAAAYDAALDVAAAELDMAKRSEQLYNAERQLLEDYPVAPVYFYVSKHLIKPDLAGFENNGLDRHPSRDMSFHTESEYE